MYLLVVLAAKQYQSNHRCMSIYIIKLAGKEKVAIRASDF